MTDILVVEDDPSVLRTLSMLLELEGYSVRAAANGAEALGLLKEQFPVLTISDIEMPVLDGPGMASQMRAENHGLEKIPIVLVSAFPNIEQIAQKIGTPYFISKPFEIDQLLELVERAIREQTPPAYKKAC